uniref:D-aminoacyl-tRNA deacylase n=1 Tax=uncultured Thiotrichaceae bacterium TaxID=298394 RepID=A0A6S6UF82_9GAMM|nr:MAG: D-tyrosyl-tRNA(Tyr) deacylase (EC [uncultured Thiotrichaceae bacterium]
MIGLIQRVESASVVIEGDPAAAIDAGIMLLLGVEKGDEQAKADRLLQRVLNYRIFADEQGRMNCSLLDLEHELLIVPQFTLPADTRKGNRPGFSPAAPPELGRELFGYFCQQAEARLGQLNCGVFGADMKVHLINDGPVTFWLQQ